MMVEHVAGSTHLRTARTQRVGPCARVCSTHDSQVPEKSHRREPGPRFTI